MTSFNSVMPSCTVTDMSKGMAFYTDVLGFECTFTNGDPICFAIMVRDSVEIGLRTRHLGGVPGTDGFYIKLNGVESLYADYQNKAVTIVHPLKTEEYGMKEFMIEDPDGNTINFGETV